MLTSHLSRIAVQDNSCDIDIVHLKAIDAVMRIKVFIFLKTEMYKTFNRRK